MTDNQIDNVLREAMKRRAAKVPPLSGDFAEKVMGRVKVRQGRFHKVALWMSAIAASVLLLLVFRFSQGPVEEQPVVAETIEQSAPQPAVPEPIVEEKQEEALPEVQPAVKSAKKRRKSVKKQSTPIEEPMLAEAEPILEKAMPMPEQAEDPIDKAARARRELRQRGEQVEQYVAMLNERVNPEHHYVEF